MALLDDSGAQALAGFFFQILGSASQAVDLLSHVDFKDHAVSACIWIGLEVLGQDNVAGTTGNPETVTEITQYKYSNSPASYPIRPTELYEICMKLAASMEAATDLNLKGLKPVLVSNRQLSPESQQQLDAAKSNTPLASIDDVVEKKQGATTVCRGRTLVLNKSYRTLLSKIEYRPQGHADFIASLKARSKRFGVFDTEIADAVQRVAGGLVSCAAGPPPRQVSLAKLDAWLTGDADPVPLTATINAVRIRNTLEEARGSLQAEKVLIRREALEQIRRASNAALIQLSGAGGCGKSVTALLALEELAVIEPLPPPFLAIGFAELIEGDWLGGLVCEWRNSSSLSLRNEGYHNTIQRLVIAADGSELPALVLVLDGLDEVATQHRGVALRILNHFKREHDRCLSKGEIPRVKLIATCREAKEVQSEWLTRGGKPDAAMQSELIEIGDFSDTELANIPSKMLPKNISEQIQNFASTRLRDSGSSVMPQSVVGRRFSAGNSTEQIDETVYEAIRHPVLLGLLAGLEPTQMGKTLSGDVDAVRSLSEQYVNWFCNKALHRKQRILEVETRAVLDAVVSHHGVSCDPGDEQAAWVSPAASKTGSDLLARRVFQEACTAGLPRPSVSPTLPLEAASERQSAFPTLVLTFLAWPHHDEPNLATILVAGCQFRHAIRFVRLLSLSVACGSRYCRNRPKATPCHAQPVTWLAAGRAVFFPAATPLSFLRPKVIVLQARAKEQITFSNGGNHEKATFTHKQQKQRANGHLRADQ